MGDFFSLLAPCQTPERSLALLHGAVERLTGMRVTDAVFAQLIVLTGALTGLFFPRPACHPQLDFEQQPGVLDERTEHKEHADNDPSLCKSIINVQSCGRTGSEIAVTLPMAVRPSALGMLVVIVLKMLTNTRNTVTKSVIRPGTISGGTKKLIQETENRKKIFLNSTDMNN